MLLLAVLGFVAGLVTGVSPCVLPVLPGILAASWLPSRPRVSGVLGPEPQPEQAPQPVIAAAVGTVTFQAPGVRSPTTQPAASPPRAQPMADRIDRRRPYLIIAGLLTSFTVLTLAGAALASALGVPEGRLRALGYLAIGFFGLSLLVPALGQRTEAVFLRIPQRGPLRTGSGFLFGLTFGVAFVPCAGPVLAAITVTAATQGLSSGLLVLATSFAVGLAIPLLLVAHLGAAAGRRLVRRAESLRKVCGVVLLATAVALPLGLAEVAQRAIPSYVAAAQRVLEDSWAGQWALGNLMDATSVSFDKCEAGTAVLRDCGPAPELTGITAWLNTPTGEAPTLAGLGAQGRVVLVDFWTYSCINCQRTLPHLIAWDEAYREDGLTIIGVHSPEFGFEHEIDNVRERAGGFGIAYPIALDNDFRTWTAYGQRYWPAKYLIDKSGRVRYVHYGEGDYDKTEELIRQLLAEDAKAPTGHAAPVADAPVLANTPETYLGYQRAAGYRHAIAPDRAHNYSGVGTQSGWVSLSGTWTVGGEHVAAGPGASLALSYSSAKVHLVLGGEGRVTVTQNGIVHEVHVTGAPTLYELRSGPAGRSTLHLDFDPGLTAYAFTFG